MSNLLKYIPNFFGASPLLPEITENINNRVNNMGARLELYVKEVVADVLDEEDGQEKKRKMSKTFSWLGNSNNPPDAIIKGGDAIEIKKLESARNTLQLNSSYPKNRLYRTDPKIADKARVCEKDWAEKNIYYAVGHCPKDGDNISSLLFVDGECYAASKNTYQVLADNISNAARNTEDVDFAEDCDELARVNNVDPLGITYLRVRGMWGIVSPYRWFEDIVQITPNKFNLIFIAKREKYDVLSDDIKNSILEKATVTNVLVSDPDNPADNIEAVYIKYEE